MQPEIECDVVIVGGGIIGLWLMASLKASGYQTLLVEKDHLGSGQTLASQGILHGGSKYALTGKLTGSSESVRAMPGRWRSHLRGERQPNLELVKVNTPHQWMWSAGGLSSKVAGFLSSKVMSGRVAEVEKEALPGLLKGRTVYQLEEPVLDIKSLLQTLASLAGDCLYQAEATAVDEIDSATQVTLQTETGSKLIRAQIVILTAGEGNQHLQAADMQSRPLHMLMVKGDLPELWGHIIEAGANPRLTITSHRHEDGDRVWYIGGQLAETGATLASEAQIQRAKQELSQLVPTIDWTSMRWSSYQISRAEGRQPGGSRPSEPVIVQQGRQVTVWPTKLVFAPLVADEIQQRLEGLGILASGDPAGAINLPHASVGHYPWDQAEWIH